MENHCWSNSSDEKNLLNSPPFGSQRKLIIKSVWNNGFPLHIHHGFVYSSILLAVIRVQENWQPNRTISFVIYSSLSVRRLCQQNQIKNQCHSERSSFLTVNLEWREIGRRKASWRFWKTILNNMWLGDISDDGERSVLFPSVSVVLFWNWGERYRKQISMLHISMSTQVSFIQVISRVHY